MNLKTNYLGLDLSSPLMPGASPMVDDLDLVKRLEDAGASAIVMHSLFEEQIARDEAGRLHHVESHHDAYSEAASFFPRGSEYRLGPDRYLEQLARIKKTVAVPVIGSLNGTTNEGWLEHGKLIEQAGADALELNVYYVATDPAETSAAIEQRVVDVVTHVKAGVKIPIAVKLSPFFSALPHLAKRLEGLGVAGLVLFNRFYQPDIDLEQLEALPALRLSDSSELLLRIRWLAVLKGRTGLDLACSGGVHTHLDALKVVMAGASAVQMVSALLRNGPAQLTQIREDMAAWLVEHEYASLSQAAGSMSLERCPDPAAFERGNYLKILNSWRF